MSNKDKEVWGSTWIMNAYSEQKWTGQGRKSGNWSVEGTQFSHFKHGEHLQGASAKIRGEHYRPVLAAEEDCPMEGMKAEETLGIC